MRVLHDWDSVTLSGRKTLREGISLIIYALTKWFPVLDRIAGIKKRNRALEGDRLAHVETLIQLDRLLGVKPIFGITDEVMTRYSDELGQVQIKYKVDMRHHFHIGSPPDSDRIRGWIPELNQSRRSWNFERDFIEGRGELEPGDLPIFHVDNPENLKHYIRYLYQVIICENS